MRLAPGQVDVSACGTLTGSSWGPSVSLSSPRLAVLMRDLHPRLQLSLRLLACFAVLLVSAAGAAAQVHYFPDGRPWKQRAGGGPDAVVDGWYYNLGLTGIRVQLVQEEPTRLLVKHVLADSPAEGKVEVGDWIVGAGGKRFLEPHENGYGMDRFGAEGPVLAFAEAHEAAQSRSRKGRLALSLLRDGGAKRVELGLGRRYGTFARGFPADCKKSDRILDELCAYLVEHQRGDGSWGSPPHDIHAPLALLASGNRKYRSAVEKNARMHARNTRATDQGGLINWRYMSAAIVLSEYYLATKERWVLDELEEIYTFLASSQYLDLSQVNPKVYQDRPGDAPRGPMDSHGGWGHNPGFEGYGPISMLTGQGALAFALMKHCGVDVDRERHDAAYAFLERGTGRNGYVWYGDEATRHADWADMGRTGAAGIANQLSPWRGGDYKKRARAHAAVIGEHPQSFPDTHGSPILGMGFAAMAAGTSAASFRSLMDANRWWFTLAQCPDGSFYYQPNRDNAGYGADSRISATAVTAFIFSIPKQNLHVTGKPFKR